MTVLNPWQYFAESTLRALRFAHREAKQQQVNEVGTEHLLLGLLREQEESAARALAVRDVTLDRVQEELACQQEQPAEINDGIRLPLTPHANKVIAHAIRISGALDTPSIRVDTDHLLLGLLLAEGMSLMLLQQLQVDLSQLRQTLFTHLRSASNAPAVEVTAKPYLLKAPFSMLTAQILSIPFAIGFTVFSIWIYLLRTGNGEMEVLFHQSRFLGNPALILLLLMGLFLLHELIHVLGFHLLCNAPRQMIKMSFSWRTLTPSVQCSVPVSTKAYRWTVLLPLLLSGIIPWAISLLFAQWVIFFFATIGIVCSFGDIYLLWLIRKYPGKRIVLVPMASSKAGK